MMCRDKTTGFDGGLSQHIHAYKLFITIILPFLVYRGFYISILLANRMYYSVLRPLGGVRVSIFHSHHVIRNYT